MNTPLYTSFIKPKLKDNPRVNWRVRYHHLSWRCSLIFPVIEGLSLSLSIAVNHFPHALSRKRWKVSISVPETFNLKPEAEDDGSESIVIITLTCFCAHEVIRSLNQAPFSASVPSSWQGNDDRLIFLLISLVHFLFWHGRPRRKTVI